MKFLKSTLLLAMMSPLAVSASEYPTLETVDYVLTCMKRNGGQTMENLYSCSCAIDILSRNISFDDFTTASTYRIYKRMPGEKGGLFRDSKDGEDVVSTLVAAEKDAEKRCFIRASSVDNRKKEESK